MRNKFYEDESTVPLSNKILIAASILCVIATIVVFIFFNKHQKSKNSNTLNNNGAATSSVSEPTETAKPTPEVVLDVIVPSEKTIGTRFNPPAGYTRVNLTGGSFGEYLRTFSLREHSTKPLSYDSQTKALVSNPSLPAVSVLELDLINKSNLQESSNSLIIMLTGLGLISYS